MSQLFLIGGALTVFRICNTSLPCGTQRIHLVGGRQVLLHPLHVVEMMGGGRYIAALSLHLRTHSHSRCITGMVLSLYPVVFLFALFFPNATLSILATWHIGTPTRECMTTGSTAGLPLTFLPRKHPYSQRYAYVCINIYL